MSPSENFLKDALGTAIKHIKSSTTNSSSGSKTSLVLGVSNSATITQSEVNSGRLQA